MVTMRMTSSSYANLKNAVLLKYFVGG